jgi:hypothetical protein
MSAFWVLVFAVGRNEDVVLIWLDRPLGMTLGLIGKWFGRLIKPL